MLEFLEIFLNSIYENITHFFDYIPFGSFFLITCLVVFCLAIFSFLRCKR